MLGKDDNIKIMQDVLCEARMGTWVMEMDEGQKSRMYADAVMLDLLGLEEPTNPEEVYRVWYANIDKDFYRRIVQTFAKVKEEGQAEIEYPWIHPKKGRMFVRCGSVFDSTYEKGIRIRGYHQNIMDMTEFHEEKKHIEIVNEEILSSLHRLFFAIYRVNPKTNSINVLRAPENSSYLGLGAANYTDYLEKISSEFWHESDRERLMDEFSIEHMLEMKNKSVDKATIEYKRIFGNDYHWASITAFYGDTSGDWITFAVQDIHEQKNREEKSNLVMENAFDAAQKATQAKNEFLSRMSHDIRTPMNVILGMTTLASAHIDDKERLEDCLDNIRKSTKLMIQLINEVLDMSKIESGKYKLDIKSFKLSSLMDNIIDMTMPIFKEKNQTITLDMSEVINDNVLGDVMRIQQVFMNILSNANKYTQEGGNLWIHVEELGYSGGQYGKYKFDFIDDGIGMEPEFLKHIFEPFSRAEDSRISKTGGTGLGMAIAYSIMQMMEGTIFVKSTPQKGSCFTVILNLRLQDVGDYKDILMKETESIDIRELQLKGKNILLVEDNEINSEIFKEILEMSGARVETAENGKIAIGSFVQSPQGYYDIIFMDIQMPIMDGNEATIMLRSLDRQDATNIPIVAMTANAFIEDIMQSRQSGMNEHIAKPIDVSKIVDVLKKWV